MFCTCGTDSKSNFTKACRVGWHREEWFIHNWHSPPNQNYLLSSDTQQRRICSPVSVLSPNKARQVFSFPLYMHSNDGCHGRDQHWPCDERSLSLSLSLFPLRIMELFFLLISSDWSCRYVQVQNNAEHFGGNTFCITFGSFSLLRLISSLYYTVLDILLWRKLHKGGFNNSWRQI